MDFVNLIKIILFKVFIALKKAFLHNLIITYTRLGHVSVWVSCRI